jgi:hypothetical protein
MRHAAATPSRRGERGKHSQPQPFGKFKSMIPNGCVISLIARR